MPGDTYYLKIFALIIVTLFLSGLTAGLVFTHETLTGPDGASTGELPVGDSDVSFMTADPDSDTGPGWVPERQFSRSGPSTRASWQGDYKIVIIATDFPDMNATRSIASLNNTVNSGMPDYYSEISYDKFTVSSTIVNSSWLEMPNNMTYYTANNKANFGQYVTDALDAAEPLIDFNQYRTQSVYVDMLILVHSGQDESTSGDPLDIWSHMSGINPHSVDSSWVRQYCTVSEFSQLGTYVHEFGHILGMPDLYDNDYSSDGIGLWGLMGSGSHLNGGNTPGHMSAWGKIQMGWLSPTLVTGNLYNQPVPDIERNEVVYKIPIPLTDSGSDEFFLIANRNKNGYDSYLPDTGLIVWHVDNAKFTSYFPNNDETHKLLDVEETTSTQHLDNRADGNLGDSTDLWSSSEIGFTPDTDPNSNSYNIGSSKFYLENIGAAGTTTYADFIVRHLYFEVSGGSNHVVKPGTEITVEVNVTSDRSGVDTLDYTLMPGTNPDWVELVTAGGSVANENDKAVAKIKVTVPVSEFPNNFAEFSLKAHSTDGTEYTSELIRVTVGQQYLFMSNQPAEVVLDPKDDTINSFKLFNIGNIKDTYSLSLLKTGGWDIKFWDAGDLKPTIDPYSNRTIDIFVEVPASARSDESSTVTITIRSDTTGTEVSLVFNVTVNTLYGLDLSTKVTTKKFNVDPGTFFQYEFTVTNTGNGKDTIGISTEPAVIAGTGTTWTYTINPSDIAMLDVSEAQIFKLEVTIPGDAPEGSEQQFDLLIVSQDGITNETVSIKVAVNQVFGMETVLDSFTKTVEPAEKAVFNFKVTNKGNGNGSYNISLTTTLPDGWLLIYPDNDDEEVEPGKTKKYTITLIPPMLATADNYKFTLKVKSLGDDTIYASFTEDIAVERVHRVDINILTTNTLEGRPGSLLNFSVTFDNRGNDVETVLLGSGMAKHGVVVYKTTLMGNTITTLKLNAGDSKTIIVTLSVYDTITEDSSGAVQIFGTLEDQSKTDEVLLYYTVNATSAEDTNGGPDSGTDNQGLFSGENTVFLLIIVIAVIVFVVLAVMLMLRKKKGVKKPVEAQIEFLGTGMPPQPQQYDQYGLAPILDAQVVEGEVFDGGTVEGGQEPLLAAGYDPQTGEVVYNTEEQPQLPPQQDPGVTGYDPETGEPIYEEQAEDEEPTEEPRKRFDPQTGEPL